MKFDFGVVDKSDKSDEAAIRRLMAENPMPGLVSVAFEREPDYFLGEGVMGERCITVKAVERETGKLAGIMCLAAADRFVNGAIRSVGYAGQVRIDREFQGTMLPLRAYPYIRSLVGDGWPELWFGVIVDNNPAAQALFVDLRRGSFPTPEAVTAIDTLAVLTRPRKIRPRKTHSNFAHRRISRGQGTGSIRVKRGDEIGWEDIVTFLNKEGARREFFPHHRVEDFIGESRTPGLSEKDFLVAEMDGEIAGVCALWDQSGFKQIMVHGYGGRLARLRPLINSVGRLTGTKRLPDIGQPIPSASLSFVAVRDDNPEIIHRLLCSAREEAFSRGKDYLMVGLSRKDPLLNVARKYRHILYRSTMYAFRFDGGVDEDSYDRDKVPYLDGATL